MTFAHSKMYGLLAATLIVAGSFSYALLTQPSNGFARAASYDIKQFSSYEELTTYINNGINTYSSYYGTRNEAMIDSTLNVAPGAELDGKSQDGGTAIDYSQTNVQVQGVDEPDVVKTDGTYLYIIANNNLLIVEAYPTDNATILATISFNTTLSPSNLFIYNNYVIVFATSWNQPITRYNTLMEKGSETSIAPWYSSPDTYIFIYDTTDKTDPTNEKELIVGGSFTSARLIDSYIYLITTQYSYGIEDNQEIKPQLLIDGSLTDIPISDIYYVDIPEKSSTFTNIISIDLDDPTLKILAEVYLLGNGNTIYVSQNNIYITYPLNYYDYSQLETLLEDIVMPMLPATLNDDLDAIDNLNLEDYQKNTIKEWLMQHYVENLSDAEKRQLALTLIEYMERTIIHRISIKEGTITYESQGSVPGTIHNQFSLSEYNNHLRISTTINGWMARQYLTDFESTNNLYILNLDLEPVGELTGLAEGETIYATRYIQDLCYLVTFEQIDPFFVIDLSQPTNPTVLGELKIPGFSTYLHPYDDTHIIGIGRDDQEVKITLFDVTDLTQPQELDTYTIENEQNEDWIWTQSTALYDHKAFLFSKTKNLLVIPVGTYSKESAHVFTITPEDGISLTGTITHDYEVDIEEEPEPRYSWDYPTDYGNSIKRTLYINNVLYTISDNMIKMNQLPNLNQLSELLLI